MKDTRKLDRPSRKIKRYIPVIAPVGDWWPKEYATFTFNIPLKEIDPEWYIGLVRRELNPSLWLDVRQKLYALRVPNRFGGTARRKLRWLGFRFWSKRYLWNRSRRFKLYQGRIVAVSNMAQEKKT